MLFLLDRGPATSAAMGVTMTASLATEPADRVRTTRERLLEAAIEMFAERGYAATGVDALCRRAGVAKTGLYWEFQSKAGLLNAVIDQVVSEWVDQITTAARVGGSPRDRLDVALSTLRQRVHDRPELFRVLLVVLAERTQVDDESHEPLRRFYSSAHAALLSGVREAVSAPLPAEELDAACEVILAMIQGVFLRSQVYGDADLDRLFATVRTTIVLMVRELVARSIGQSTLDGPIAQSAK